jgi:hypothetical protein
MHVQDIDVTNNHLAVLDSRDCDIYPYICARSTMSCVHLWKQAYSNPVQKCNLLGYACSDILPVTNLQRPSNHTPSQ